MKILSSDFLIADFNIDLKFDEKGKFSNLIKKYNFEPGEKYSIDVGQYEEFVESITDYPHSKSPGGTASNILYTLCSLAGSKVEATFIGALGGSDYSRMIKQSLDRANIKLIPHASQFDARPETTITFNLIFPDGRRASVTYPGNAKDVLKTEFITDEEVGSADVIMVLGSLWQKLGYRYPDTLMEKRWEQKKQLWLCMPTNAKFGLQKAGLFQHLTPSANDALSNGNELQRVMQASSDEEAIYKLQEKFRQKDSSGRNILQSHGFAEHEQLGFVTLSDKGCVLVTEDDIIEVPSFPVPRDEVVNEMGAGDLSYGAFLFGKHVAKLSLKDSALMAMAMGAEKVKCKTTRLDSPAETYLTLLPKAAEISSTLKIAMPKLLDHFRHEFGITSSRIMPENIR